MHLVFNATDAWSLYYIFAPIFKIKKLQNNSYLLPTRPPPHPPRKSHNEQLVWFNNAVEHWTLPAHFKWLILKRGKNQEWISQSLHEHGQRCSQAPVSGHTAFDSKYTTSICTALDQPHTPSASCPMALFEEYAVIWILGYKNERHHLLGHTAWLGQLYHIWIKWTGYISW